MDIDWLRANIDQGRLTISRLEDGSGVVLDIEGEQLLEMNASALAMVQAVADGAQDEQAVAAAVGDRFNVSADRVAADVRAFLTRLEASLRR